MRLVLDCENTVVRTDNRIDGSPFHPANKLVSVGMVSVEDDMTIGQPEYLFFHHNELVTADDRSRVQDALDRTTLLIGHNIKHDLQWLLACGFTYDGPLYDTMIAEYVLARGVKMPLNLADTCDRRGLRAKRKDLTDEYWNKKVGFEAMPIEVVREYGIGDILATAELFIAQRKDFSKTANTGLIPTVQMSNEFCRVLTEMEMAGIAIDMDMLNQIEAEYIKEKETLEAKLRTIVFDVMGDTPINLGSPEQLSMVIYSRRVNDKEAWGKQFCLGNDERGKPLRRPKMKDGEFKATVKSLTSKVHKTKAHQCPECKGTGKYHKIKKDGSPFAKAFGCKHCDATGLVYESLRPVAGLQFDPKGVDWVSAGGFATDKETLDELITEARATKNEQAIEFLGAIKRLNAVDVYLSSFVGGIRKATQADGLLHCHFNQCITSTARLSSSDPNFQNQPRGKTFPVRRAIVSRFPGGSIMEADFAQLEFRCAAEMAGCPDAERDILAGVDAHQFTADTLTNAGQATDRQGAKPHTFKPLYGGLSGTPAEKTYYEAFLTVRYPRIGEWHKELQEQVIQTRVVRLPSRREYHWPNAKRLPYQSNEFTICSNATQIKNWPVQGFATGDIVPCGVIELWRALKAAKVRSILINTVHDSVAVDVYPGEEAIVARLMQETLGRVKDALKRRYDYDFRIPLLIEIKYGPNWLDGKLWVEPEQQSIAA